MASAAPPSDSTPAHDAIDAIRTFAALAVVWNHVWNMIAGPMPADGGWLVHLIYISAGFGQDAVFVFFVISGYWIGRSILGKLRDNRWDWRDYAIDRIARLWIVVVPALLVGGTLDTVGRWALDLPLYRAMTVTGEGAFDVGERLDPAHALISLVFLQETVLPPFGSNVPLWSLAYEFWYYVWFPVLALIVVRRRLNLAALLGVAITGLALTTYLRAFPVWLLGAGVAKLSLRVAAAIDNRVPRGSRRAIGIGLVCFVAAEGAVHMLNLGFIPSAITIGLGFAALLWGLLRSPVHWPRWLRGFSRYGAGSSFSLYAIHFPVLALCVALLPRQSQPAMLLVAALGLTAFLAGWGYLFSRFTERNTGWLRTRMRQWLVSNDMREVV
jgi:peptidoglycan/LPS O-acetylase OafA/YrhL